MGAFFAGIFVAYVLLSSVLVPIVAFGSWMAKRDCELINRTGCQWVMQPKGGDDELAAD